MSQQVLYEVVAFAKKLKYGNISLREYKMCEVGYSLFLVIVKKSSPKNLSVNCRPTHYGQFTDRLPTANRQATDSFPKKKIVEKTRIKHDIETIIISIDITYLPIDGKTISSDMFIESF